jgi:hypothetical protein
MNRTHNHPRREPLDDGEAFIPDRTRLFSRLTDDAEADAEEFVAGATSGDAVFEDARNEVPEEELVWPTFEADLGSDLASEIEDALGDARRLLELRGVPERVRLLDDRVLREMLLEPRERRVR